MIYDHLGRQVNVEFVENILKLKGKSGSNPWPVIKELFKAWEKTNPSEYKSHLLYIKDTRSSRKDSKFASVYDKVHGGYLRYTLDIPERVMQMIRKVYTVEELPMTRSFFLEFAKRFPNYKVASKL